MLLAALLNARVVAQSYGPASQPAFDVTSVKASIDAPSSLTVSHGNLTISSWSLKAIIAWAYDVPFGQVRAPDWASVTRFDIIAKPAAPAPETQVRLMLQTLLAERFKLTLHHETREFQVMAMIAPTDVSSRLKPSAGEGFMRTSNDRKTSRLEFQHANMADVAAFLSALGPATVDRTGITGRYDFSAPYGRFLDLSDTSDAAVFAARREGILAALGLKLESRKLPMDVIVVDHCEKAPTAN